MELALTFLHEINFLLVPGSPEIDIGRNIQIAPFFKPFHEDEVLPQLAHVVSCVRRVEVGNEGVAYAVVVKIVFAFFCNIFSQVTAESPYVVNNKGPFKNLQIASHRFRVDAKLAPQLIEGNFTDDLKGE